MSSKFEFQRSTPEAEGIASAALLAFVDAVDQLGGLHSLMLVRHGRVVAEGWWHPYAREYPHMLFSLSKSFTSTAIGLAVAEGRLTVDDAVISFFPEERPATVSKNLAAMRVRDLLTMTSGHGEDTTRGMHERPDGNWIKAFLEQPVTHEPGTYFVYNSGATFLLSAILQKLTGERLLDYLQPRLFQPLGIENPTWEQSPQGIDVGGWGLSITTEDIARFGQLYLQQGHWQGQQLVPQEWVKAATAAQVDNSPNANRDWEQGYGYQFWRCRHNAYRGDGAFGQFCIVLPAQEAVLAINAGVGNMQAVLDQVWAHLLPAFQAEPLPADAQAHEALRQRLAGLAMPLAQGEPSSPVAQQVSGRCYHIETPEQPLESVSLTFQGNQAILTLHAAQGDEQIVCGSGEWATGWATLEFPRPQRVAASGAWIAPDTYQMQLCFYETPFCPTITCRFVGDQLFYDGVRNVSFGPLEGPQLVGRLAESIDKSPAQG
jgi:CubicO group peptidase (beta-lactamase class C family)